MSTDTTAPDAPTPLDIRTLPHTSPLARDYASAFARVADFFAGDPADAGAWIRVADAVRAHPAHAPAVRERLVSVLAAQQAARQAGPEARAAAARLTDPATVAVVTGQQAGLFGGPIYTLLKALSAIALARHATAERGTPAVPIFWVDAEDHDWAEVRGCQVVGAEDTVTTIQAADLPGAGSQPVGHLRFDETILDTLATLEAALPPTPYTAEVVTALRRAYQPGVGVGRACAVWLEALLGPLGLVVFESDDAAAKPLVSALFAAEVTAAPRTARLAAEAGERLTALGYHAQVQPATDAAALFAINGARQAIAVEGDTARAGDRRTTREALAAEAASAPERFGPNVLLRPLVQDTLFPTVCYVAGPGELAYLAQLKGVYAAHGLPMPLVQTRASATFIDSNAGRFLARHQIEIPMLAAQDERLLNGLLAAQLPAAVDEAGEDAAAAITRTMDALAAAAAGIDATLEGAVRSAAGRMHDDLKKVRGKILQAAKKKDDTLRRQFRHAQVQTYPDGEPQERLIGFVALLNRVGPGLIDTILAQAPPASGRHWLVTL